VSRLCALLVLVFVALPVQAREDPGVDKRVMSLASELRCLVCQNQTLADSNAELAVDMRNRIREEVVRGASDEEVVELMVSRYGDFVLYRPPFKATTWLLWAGPFILLALGATLLVRRVRQGRPADGALSEAERARAARLLDDNGK
jgi:cytochrome c-type biogenesis protein CcmH